MVVAQAATEACEAETKSRERLAVGGVELAVAVVKVDVADGEVEAEEVVGGARG